MEIIEIMWDNVRPDPNQPRKSFDPNHLEAMEASFRSHGQITPARVRPDPDGSTPFVLVDGECRWKVGRKLHQAEPDNPRFARFHAFVDDVDKNDLIVVQFLANGGAHHTPAEKVAVMKRLIEAGMKRNKLRSVLGITKGQFRYLRELLESPKWLQSYGAPQSLRMPVTDETGCLVRDEDGAIVTNERTVEPLPLSHLAVLARHAARLIEWDKEQQAAHPDGDHINVAQRTICSLADRALRDGWPVSRLTKRCATAVEVAMHSRDLARLQPGSPRPAQRPFSRDAKGGLRIPTTDPSRLSADAVDALTLELEQVLAQLRAGRGSSDTTTQEAVAELTGV